MFKIINYGFGNVCSISNMLNRIGIKNILINSPKEVQENDTLILPGVGSYDNAIKSLSNLGFYDFLKNQNDFINFKLVGICLGLQILCDGSEEGTKEGLGLVKGVCKKFDPKSYCSETLIGWSKIILNDQFHKKNFLENLPKENRFYFLHSYYFPVNNQYTLLTAKNHNQHFSAVIKYKNIYGFQFHPERSHKFGMNLFKILSKI
jgi:glutamine amidotransferase